jgi:hypothetical protein
LPSKVIQWEASKKAHHDSNSLKLIMSDVRRMRE